MPKGPVGRNGRKTETQTGEDYFDELSSVIEGFVEQALPEQVQGWAFHRDRPNMHLAINIYCGGHLLGSTNADIFRSDLANGRIGSGDHAFRFHFPTKLDQQQMAAVVGRGNHARAR